jgi:polysaccharide biosynthesis transport protein
VKDPSPYKIGPAAPVPGPVRETPYVVIGEDEFTRADLRQYWRVIRKHLWLALAVPLAFVMLTAARDLMATRLYTARTTILIKNNAPQVYEYTSMDTGTGADGATQWNINNKTEYTLLESRNLANRVILAEGLFANPLFAGAHHPTGAPDGGGTQDPGGDAEAADALNEQAPVGLINRYLADLKVAPIEETELVAVSFTTPSAALSARVANAHVQEFMRQGIELNSQASDQAAQFLQKKLAQLKRQVEESELALNNYRRDKGLIPGLISLNGQDVVLGRLDKLSEQVEHAHLANLNFETQVALIDQGHTDALPAVIDSKIVQTLKENLDALQPQYLSMSSQFKPDYLPMVELITKIKGIRDALRHEVDNISDSIRAQYAASLKDEEALDAELKRQKDFALGLNDAAVKYAILQREADTNTQLYHAVLTRMKDVEVAADLHASNVSVVDRATAPAAPSSPRQTRDLLAAALLGLMAGVGLAFLLERHDHTFKDAGEIETYLRVPQLGMIPRFQRLGGPVYGASEALKSLGDRPSSAYPNVRSLSYGGSSSPAGEAYRMLRTSLLLSRAGAPPKTTLVASAVPGEGKTTTAANLSIVLAGTGRKVLLIDADLRRPHCHEVFGVDNGFGLTEALTGIGEPADLIRHIDVGNLYLLTSGTTPPNPSELLGSEKMRELFDSLSRQYNCIIIDTAPITLVTDAVMLSSMVDGVLVVAHKRTARQQVKAALLRLEYAQAKVFGVVLNGVDLGFGYDGYTSQYYKYGYSSNGHPSDAVIGK